MDSASLAQRTDSCSGGQIAFSGLLRCSPLSQPLRSLSGTHACRSGVCSDNEIVLDLHPKKREIQRNFGRRFRDADRLVIG